MRMRYSNTVLGTLKLTQGCLLVPSSVELKAMFLAKPPTPLQNYITCYAINCFIYDREDSTGHMPCICQHRRLVSLVAPMVFIQLALPTTFIVSPMVRETMRPSLALPSDLLLLHAILPTPQCGPTNFLSYSKDHRAISLCGGAQTTSAGKASFCGRNLVRFCQHLRQWRPRGPIPFPSGS